MQVASQDADGHYAPGEEALPNQVIDYVTSRHFPPQLQVDLTLELEIGFKSAGPSILAGL